MVDEESLKSWVEKKLDEGVDESRIKKSLRETGHDPSIVDEVKSPFEQEADVSEDVFMEEGSSESSNTVSDRDTRSSETDGSNDYSYRSETDEAREEVHKPEKEQSRISLPSLSFPDLPVWPAVWFLVLLIGITGYVFLPWPADEVEVDFEVPNMDSVSNVLDSGDASEEGCPDVGVRIEDVSVVEGETVVDVLVTRGEADVILKVLSNGELVDSSTDRIGGTGTIKVSSEGDEVLFHPVGCERFRDSESVS